MRADGELYRDPTEVQVVKEKLKEISQGEFERLNSLDKKMRKKELALMRGKDVFATTPKRTPFGTNYFNRSKT